MFHSKWKWSCNLAQRTRIRLSNCNARSMSRYGDPTRQPVTMYWTDRDREKRAIIGRPKQEIVSFFDRTWAYCAADDCANTSDWVHFINLRCTAARSELDGQFNITAKKLLFRKWIFSISNHMSIGKNYYIRLTAFPRKTWVSGTRNVNHSGFYCSKRWWGGSGISWTIYKSFAPRSRQITMPVPHHSVFTGRMPFLPPNQQHQGTEDICLPTARRLVN